MPLSCFAQDAGNNADSAPGIESPSVELLEFLGQWETRHGDWLNPNIFADNDFGAILEGAANSGSNTDNDISDDNDNSDDNGSVDGANNG